jgi:hypothetical protein
MMDFKVIEEKINRIKSFLVQSSNIILTEDVSRYPIFVVSTEDMNIGIPLLVPHQVQEVPFFINASTLEEFYVKKMIESDKIDEFRKTYQNPETHLCIFLVNEGAANFIFIKK